jgi:hypothetical protein
MSNVEAVKPEKPAPAEHFIDLTPTWSGVLPVYLVVLRDGSEEGRREAVKELQRMAQAADLWNAYIKAQESINPLHGGSQEGPKV